MGEKMDKAVEEVRKAVEEEMEAARAEGRLKTKMTKEEVKEDGKVVKVIETTTMTTTEEDLDSSPQVIELEKEITRLKRQVVDQIGNIETLLKQRDKQEKVNTWLKGQVKLFSNAAKCQKPRGSCRTCTSTPCYFKDKMTEEK